MRLAKFILLISVLLLAQTVVTRAAAVTSQPHNEEEEHHEPAEHHEEESHEDKIHKPSGCWIGNHSDDGNHTGSHGIHVVHWNFDYVRQPLIISIFMIVAALCKLGFHHLPLSLIIPESCMLIVLGVLVGAILQQVEHVGFPTTLPPTVFFLYLLPPVSGVDKESHVRFDSQLFFLYLLPPIILESAYSLHDRVFLDNIGTILVYAVIGTILNCFFIGLALYGLAICGAMGTICITLVQCLVFSALIVAVDPVAVLAIFQEIGVNNVLYFLVFGESLLNDAVTVVLYNMMKTFNEMDTIPPNQIGLGIANFFTVSLGGLSIGILFGACSSFLTKYTKRVQVVEPLTLFALAYTSYLVAELFHFSGIISIIGCGLVQAQYAFHNISHKSYITVTYFSKMISATCDCIIFMFLGLAVVRDDHVWHAGFILWTLLLCLLFRFLIVFALTYLVNKLDRVKAIDLEEQFIMAYGGLRGAVAFCLVAMLNHETLPHQRMFETTTLIVIFFTVFVQGISIKPLVRLLRITKSEELPVCIYEEINYRVTDHVMAGVEEIIGRSGYNVFLEQFERIDDKYFKRWLQRDPQGRDASIMQLYEKIALYQHYENIGGAEAVAKYTSDLDLYEPEKRLRLPSTDGHHLDPVLLQKSLEMGGRTSHYSPFLSPGTPGSVFFPSSPYPRTPPRGSPCATPPRHGADNTKRRKTLATTGLSEDDALSPASVPKQRRKSWFPWRRPSMDALTRSEPADDDIEEGAEPRSPRANRFRSAVLTIMRKGSYQKPEEPTAPEPTVGDVRRWMVANPSKSNFHRKYDKNLTRNHENDLLHHLQEKHKRLKRYRKSVISLSMSPSEMGTPYDSTENVQGQRQSALEVIREDSMDEAAQDQRTRPQSFPTGSEKKPKKKSRNPRLQKSYTVDNADETASKRPRPKKLTKAASIDVPTPTPSGSDPEQHPLLADPQAPGAGDSVPLETIKEEPGSIRRKDGDSKGAEKTPESKSPSQSPEREVSPSNGAGSDSDGSVSIKNRGKLDRQLAKSGDSQESKC